MKEQNNGPEPWARTEVVWGMPGTPTKNLISPLAVPTARCPVRGPWGSVCSLRKISRTNVCPLWSQLSSETQLTPHPSHTPNEEAVGIRLLSDEKKVTCQRPSNDRSSYRNYKTNDAPDPNPTSHPTLPLTWNITLNSTLMLNRLQIHAYWKKSKEGGKCLDTLMGQSEFAKCSFKRMRRKIHHKRDWSRGGIWGESSLPTLLCKKRHTAKKGLGICWSVDKKYKIMKKVD